MSNIKLLNEDCFYFLNNIPDNSIDLVLIDPPYEISRNTNFANSPESGKDTDRFRISMDFGKWDHNSMDMPEVIKECYRVLKKSGTLICFYDLWKITALRKYLEEARFKQFRYIEWVKTNPVPLNSKINYLTNAREIAIVGVKEGKPTFHSEYDNGIYNFPICHDKGRFHPTQKPVALIEALIVKHSDENDLICDCFSGSGTTAIAACNTKRNFLGCELSKEYYEKTLIRFKENGVIYDNSNMEGAI